MGAEAGTGQELYEPLWEDLLAESKKLGFRIRSIIIADAAWQGKSGQLNASKLGNDRELTPFPRTPFIALFLLSLLRSLVPPIHLVCHD